jgi:hypothetical protein
MQKKNIFISLFFILIFLSSSFCQDMMDLFKDSAQTANYTYATFKTTRIVNGQSIENPSKGVLLFMISHRFGQLNQGAYEFFGLDQSSIRLGLEYGIGDRLAIGAGRSSYDKNFDGFLKYKIIRQQTGKRMVPLSISWYSSVSLISLKWQYPERDNYFSSRLSYVNQLLIARKFSNSISLQLTPSMVHINLVPTSKDQNDIYSIGFGGRLKLTKRLSVNAEYFYVLPGTVADAHKNSFSIGFDIETGGHVFQLHCTNSTGMFDRAFITETTGDWLKGGIHFGFNISRVFTVARPKSFKSKS